MRVWLHQSVGDEGGWNAWCLDLLGFATWAPSEEAVLKRLPGKVEEHLCWLESHGLHSRRLRSGADVVERVMGNEVIFSTEKLAVPTEMIDLTLRLLTASREDLTRAVEQAPEEVLDWDPPYSSFAPWATWRTIRQILAHIANTETHYYLAKIGFSPRGAPAREDGDWREFLAVHRAETLDRLRELRASDDLSRIRQFPEDQWSVSKVLRRLVRHEILHRKSISRIAGAFQHGTSHR